ncbi:hypothetical protein D3C81_2155410 [compost metagenome]
MTQAILLIRHMQRIGHTSSLAAVTPLLGRLRGTVGRPSPLQMQGHLLAGRSAIRFRTDAEFQVEGTAEICRIIETPTET